MLGSSGPGGGEAVGVCAGLDDVPAEGKAVDDGCAEPRIDLAAMESFYCAVLGWTLRPASLGEDFRVALHEGRPVAGVGALDSTSQFPVAWTPYFAVEDADETAVRIRERSATVAVGPLKFPVGRGALRSPVNRGALAADRDGTVFGIGEGQLIADRHSWLRTRRSGCACGLQMPSRQPAGTSGNGDLGRLPCPRWEPAVAIAEGAGLARTHPALQFDVAPTPSARRPAPALFRPGTVHFSTSREAKPRPRISFGRHCDPNKRYGRTGVR